MVCNLRNDLSHLGHLGSWLEEVDVSWNRLGSLEALLGCTSLRHLCAGGNQLRSLPHLIRLLRQLRCLRHADFSRNVAVAATPDYRLLALAAAAPTLVLLDCRPVLAQEREEVEERFATTLGPQFLARWNPAYRRLAHWNLARKCLKKVCCSFAEPYLTLVLQVGTQHVQVALEQVFVGVETVDLSENDLGTVGDLGQCLLGLRELNLCGNGHLGSLGEGSGGWGRLAKLSIASCQLKELKRLELRGVVNLSELDISGNQLSSLEGLEGLSRLRVLDGSGNRLRSVRVRELECVRGLRRLSLGRNQLSSMPRGLGVLRELEWLELSGNQLSSLGSVTSIGELPALRSLSLQVRMKDVGLAISEVPFSVQGNQVTGRRLYRRFLVTRCLTLTLLDEIPVSAQEMSGREQEGFDEEPPSIPPPPASPQHRFVLPSSICLFFLPFVCSSFYMLENPMNDPLIKIRRLEKFRKNATQGVEDRKFTIFSSLRILIKESFLGFSSMEISFSKVRELSEHGKVPRRCR